MVDLYRSLKTRYPGLVLVLVPRHVERTPQIVETIRPMVGRLVMRSDLSADRAQDVSAPDVLLVDTTGELKDFYAHADIIFVGKSLTRHGGQNVIEPALCGKPIIVGPNMENFRAILQDFLAADALIQVSSAGRLRQAVDELLCSPERRDALGRAARRVVEKGAGAVGQFIEELTDAGMVKP
jgi:3-deoxy-D-manno-octulosonic-acid transferase